MIRKIVIVLLSTSLGLAVGEFFLRIANVDFTKRLNPSLYWNHLRDLATGKVQDQAIKYYSTSLNYDESIGHIEPNLLNVSQMNSKRIFIFGDSMISDMSFQKDFFRHWQEISSVKSSASEIQFVATVGWNTWNQWKWLEKYQKEISPDTIVIAFNINDFSTTPVIVRQGRDAAWAAFQPGPMARALSSRGFLECKLGQLLFWLATLIDNYDEAREFPSSIGYQTEKDSLAKMVQFAEKQKAKIQIIVMPIFEKFSDNSWFGRGYQAVNRLLDELYLRNITCDLVPQFRNEETEKWRKSETDQAHSNAMGSDYLAQQMISCLKK